MEQATILGRLFPGVLRRLLVLIVLLLASTLLLFAAITAKEIIEKVQERYDDMSDAVVTFTQKVRFKVSRMEQQTTGTLYFKKKNKYRIETEQRTVVTDGKSSWSYNAQNKQLVISAYKEDARSMSPEKLLTQYPKDYYSALTGEEKVGSEACYALKLTPREESGAAKTMKIWVSKAWLIRKLEITDLNGTVTTYQIKDVLVDKGIPDTRFDFKAPQGADVIDLR
jgi:outer membrane lipoprotein carrier protein